MPLGLVLVRAEFPCGGMYPPGGHWHIEFLYDGQRILNMLPAGNRIMIGEGNSRIHLQRQCFQVRISGRLSRLKAASRLQTGVRDVSGAHQSRGYSKMCLYPPMPMQEKVWCGPGVEDLTEILQCTGVILLIQLGVTGRNQRDCPGLHRMPIGIAAYVHCPKPADSLEIEAEASQPRFPEHEDPRVYFIFLGCLSSSAIDSKGVA